MWKGNQTRGALPRIPKVEVVVVTANPGKELVRKGCPGFQNP